jgi:hypothetical protein
MWNMWYSKLDETFVSRPILHHHSYTCPIALPVRRNPQHRCHLTVLSHIRTSVYTSSPSAKHLPPWGQFLDPVVNRITRQTLPTVNRNHFFMNTLYVESLCQQKKKSTTWRWSSAIHSSSTVAIFDYWNQSLNTCMCVCCLDCHEAKLCCYLVIHIENLLCPLQLFYFHLWPIYWLSLVCTFSLFNFLKSSVTLPGLTILTSTYFGY